MKSRLAQSALFSGLAPQELDVIEKTGRVHQVGAGGFVFMEDDPADRFFVVLSGRVKISKSSPEGKEQILLIAGPGDSFGEAALFAGRKFPASAEMVADGTLLSFEREDFLGLIKRHPALAMNIIAGLSVRLHHLTHLIQQLSLEDVTTRLAGYLIELLTQAKTPDAVTVTLTEKKMTLAALLGTIPETLSRGFARLSRLGVITVDGDSITIRDKYRLSELASGKKI